MEATLQTLQTIHDAWDALKDTYWAASQMTREQEYIKSKFVDLRRVAGRPRQMRARARARAARSRADFGAALAAVHDAISIVQGLPRQRRAGTSAARRSRSLGWATSARA